MKHSLTMPEILYALRRNFLPGCEDAAINTFALSDEFEADFLGVTRAGFIHEVEVKLSRGDFFKDFEKRSNQQLAKRVKKLPEHIQARYPHSFELKHDLIQAGKLANYFWFAVPRGLVKLEEVPAYAGLIELFDTGDQVIAVRLREAPRLHKGKAETWFYRKLLRCMAFRAWRELERNYLQASSERYQARKLADAERKAQAVQA